jgi:internalin A
MTAEKKVEKPAPPPAPKSIFPDPNLEKAVRKQVFAKRDKTDPITAEDVVNISTIEGRSMGIKDLTGLEKCTALASLTLPGNQITSLAPIKGLARLQFLDVSQNQIADIAPLAECKALQYVELTGNKVADVKPLGGIQSLTSLYLANNQISDASPSSTCRKSGRFIWKATKSPRSMASAACAGFPCSRSRATK